MAQTTQALRTMPLARPHDLFALLAFRRPETRLFKTVTSIIRTKEIIKVAQQQLTLPCTILNKDFAWVKNTETTIKLLVGETNGLGQLYQQQPGCPFL